jgi:dTDP-4-amino-4,6-dideoxygalactose transaminase
MLAAGIKQGDEVITAPSSFFATAEAISLCGATPVFVDVEKDTLNLDPALLAKAITPKTRAIVPVHLFGQAADMTPILDIAKAKGLLVIEDAAQAHGTTYGDKKAGSMGLAGCFSFYPGKNLGAFGEGGAVTTNDDDLARRINLLRDHGSPEKYKHTVIGFNYRLEGIQGAVLGVKLRHLEKWTEARRAHAKRYQELLKGVGDLRLPVERPYGRHVYHLYSVRTAAREKVFAEFERAGIARAIHYPIPIHLQEAYAFLKLGPGSFPVAEAAAREQFSLPLFPELTTSQQDQVIAAVVAAFR